MYLPSVDEAKKLLSAVDLKHPFGARDYALCQLGFYTGLRVAELSGLDQSDVAFQGAPRSTLHVRAAIAKGRRGRDIILHPKAQAAIRCLLLFNERRGLETGPDAPLFQCRKHQRLSVRAIERLVQALREKAGLDVPITPHSMRHSYGTRLAGVASLRTVQINLGHVRLSTTQRYVNPSPEQQRQEIERLR